VALDNVWEVGSLDNECIFLPAVSQGGNGVWGAFQVNNIIANFMVYEDRLQTNLLQLFTDPENSEWFSILSVIIIIIIFYCGLMVHITNTGAQKVVSYTSAHITETMFAHDQH